MTYIQTEPTPNPLAMKFLLEAELLPKGKTINCTNIVQASISPLAKNLFDVIGVSNVFLGNNFVTITKREAVDWSDLKLNIITIIMDFLGSGLPILNGFSFAQEVKSIPLTDPLSLQIESVLEEKVRPAVAQDGGDIIFRGFQEGIVYLELQGSCSGCPSSTVTLKMGIENMLKYYIPEVVSVEEVSNKILL